MQSKPISRKTLLIFIFVSLIAGIIIGGYLFADSQRRFFLAIHQCNDICYKASDLLGLLGSVGIQRFDNILPTVVKETDRTIAIKHPNPDAPIHFVVIPKKDIKNMGDLAPGDEEYLIDTYAVLQALIHENNLKKYKIYTYGPGLQQVTYLHFHLTAEK